MREVRRQWVNGQHVWRGTGNQSKDSELDLAVWFAIIWVMKKCINFKKGQEGGQTWEYRAGYIDGKIDERKRILGELVIFELDMEDFTIIQNRHLLL